MKKYFVLLIASVLTSNLMLSQSSIQLRGKVLFQSSKNKPAIGVEISGMAEGNLPANAVSTTSTGEFILYFSQAKPGLPVELKIGHFDKYGQEIEVVNTKEVDVFRLSANTVDVFEIIVCIKGSRDIAAQKYYNIIKTSADIEFEKAREELSSLLNQRVKDSAKINVLIQKVNELQRDADSLTIYKEAFRIASINEDKADQITLEYLNLLKAGKSIREAREVLNIGEAAKLLREGLSQEKSSTEVFTNRINSSAVIFDYKDAIACLDTLILIHKENNSSELELANLYFRKADFYKKDGNIKKTLEFQLNALNIRKSILKPNHPDLAHAFNEVGITYQILREDSISLDYHQKSISIRKAFSPPNYSSLATSYNNIANTYKSLGELDQALKFLERSIEIRGQHDSTDYIGLAASYNNIAIVYRIKGNPKDALNFDLKSLRIREKLYERDNPQIAFAYDHIGLDYQALGEYNEALEFQEAALDIRSSALHPNHPELAYSFNNISTTYYELGEYDEAILYLKKATKILQSLFESMDLKLVINYENTAALYQRQKRYKEALPLQELAIKISEQNLPPFHKDLPGLYSSIGSTYNGLGIYDSAVFYQKKSIAIRKRILPPHNLLLGISYGNLANTYLSMQKFAKAIRFMDKNIEIFEVALSNKHKYYNMALAKKLEIFEKRGTKELEREKYVIAKKDFKKVISEANSGYENLSRVWYSLGICNLKLKNYPDAIEAFVNSDSLNRDTLPNQYYYNLGQAYIKLNNSNQAKLAFDIYEKHNPNTIKSNLNWVQYYSLVNDTQKALTHLSLAIKFGFKDKSWLRKEKVLSSLPNSKKLFRKEVSLIGDI